MRAQESMSNASRQSPTVESACASLAEGKMPSSPIVRALMSRCAELAQLRHETAILELMNALHDPRNAASFENDETKRFLQEVEATLAVGAGAGLGAAPGVGGRGAP